MRITFDQALVTDPMLNALDWLWINAGFVHLGVTAAAFGTDVIAVGPPIIPLAEPDSVSFSATAMDVIGLLNGLPALTFAAFPVT